MLHIFSVSLYFHHLIEFCNIQVRRKTFTLICIVGFRKKKRVNNLFIHLNLCIALALGLIVFVAGIETATDYRVSAMHW